MKSNKRTLILLLLLVIVAIIGIPMIQNNLGGDTSAEAQAQVADSSQSIRLLAQFESIKLDTSIFNSAEFQYLSDFTLPLLNIPIGRLNPFASVR